MLRFQYILHFAYYQCEIRKINNNSQSERSNIAVYIYIFDIGYVGEVGKRKYGNGILHVRQRLSVSFIEK